MGSAQRDFGDAVRFLTSAERVDMVKAVVERTIAEADEDELEVMYNVLHQYEQKLWLMGTFEEASSE